MCIIAFYPPVLEANCRAILDDEASVNGLLASLTAKRDPRVQQGAATSVANLVSHPEHGEYLGYILIGSVVLIYAVCCIIVRV